MTTKSSRNRTRKGVDVNNDKIITNKEKVLQILTKKINIKAKNEEQKEEINIIKNSEISFVAGPAGTGKTFIALATALDLLSDPNTPYVNIYLVKSVTTLPQEEIGFLKGELEDKIQPFMWSYLMNINKLISESVINILTADGIVKPLPLAFIRGLSIDNSIIILDETQNVTLSTLRTLMTRIGDNTKLICLGDTKQIDLKSKNKSSLKIAMDLFRNVDNKIAVMEYSNNSIVRNPLIKIIEQKFDEFEDENDSNLIKQKRTIL